MCEGSQPAEPKSCAQLQIEYAMLIKEQMRKQGVSVDTLDELFQYPRGRGRTSGIIRHWKGHRNHFHIRFHK